MQPGDAILVGEHLTALREMGRREVTPHQPGDGARRRSGRYGGDGSVLLQRRRADADEPELDRAPGADGCLALQGASRSRLDIGGHEVRKLLPAGWVDRLQPGRIDPVGNALD